MTSAQHGVSLNIHGRDDQVTKAIEQVQRVSKSHNILSHAIVHAAD